MLSEAGAGLSPAAGPEVTARPGAGPPPAIGGLAVPPWRAGLEADVLPQAYRDLVEVTEDAGRPLRAAQIAAAAGLSTDKAKVETLRGKLLAPSRPRRVRSPSWSPSWKDPGRPG